MLEICLGNMRVLLEVVPEQANLEYASSLICENALFKEEGAPKACLAVRLSKLYILEDGRD